MKNLLLLLLLATTAVNAQWIEGNFTDDFGDPTDKRFLSQKVVGTFSNSATSNSECTYLLVRSIPGEDKPYFYINIHPYSRAVKESWIESDFGTLKIKDPNNQIWEVPLFASKTGTILFSKKNYTELMLVLSTPGTYTAIYKHNSKYSSNSYKFSFEM